MATLSAAASIHLALPLSFSFCSSSSSSSSSSTSSSSCSLGFSCRPPVISRSSDELVGLSSRCFNVRFKGGDDYAAAEGWRLGSGRGRRAAAGGAARASIGGIRIALPFISGKGDRQKVKEELLEAIEGVDRGAEASPQDELLIDKIAKKLEALNPTKEPLKSPLLNGKWQLLYTTSRSILKKDNPKFLRPWGPIYQSINSDTLRAQNMETWPFFNQVTANLVPLSSSKVAVSFDTFKIGGLISIKAPGRARGELEVTYLDEKLRSDEPSHMCLKIQKQS
ncbi:hypothetical protein O6H91_11G028500 [Diphasiastrum complanatum]|uniref:Uncharacterized protein n=1 Tax=Diphasiastrum complanatum TaxID=34168 RepID=A0ACC2C7U2_DIPCM|nr:hypothetical protein O6H91_11G028500 [Diphasiastrum complanatum]